MLCGCEVNRTLTRNIRVTLAEGVLHGDVFGIRSNFLYISSCRSYAPSGSGPNQVGHYVRSVGLGFHDSLKLKCNPKGEEIGPVSR